MSSAIWLGNWSDWNLAFRHSRVGKGALRAVPTVYPDHYQEMVGTWSLSSGGASRRPVGFAHTLLSHTATSCSAALLARFAFFTFDGPNSEPAASPAVSATHGSRDTMAATMAPSINRAS